MTAPRPGSVLVALALGALLGLGGVVVLATLALSAAGTAAGCAGGSAPLGVALGPPGSGAVVGASEYGGPGDPSSGVIGASGANLVAHPDSYAELGGTTFATATMMGGLAYMTPLRITWDGRSALAYKRDFGLGGGPIDGHPRVIDLWWQLAGALGIPYEDGRWSGPVRVARPPATGAAWVLGQAATGAVGPPAVPSGEPVADSSGETTTDPSAGNACAPPGDVLALTPGSRARLDGDGLAQAPAGAPPAVQAMIAAGNAIAGRPYVYGAGHGLALSQLSPAYDCSSSVEHLLYGAGLIPVTDTVSSGVLESFGAPGPGRWVTLYANADHVFMYVAGLRWDTWNAAGAGDGSSGIGWHPLIRSSAGFVARHPVGL